MVLVALIVIALAPASQEEATPQWVRRHQWKDGVGPQGREHAAFVVDSARGRAVMVAGSGYRPYGTPLADAWAFDFADESWAELEVIGDELTPGGSRRAAVVEGGAFLHGGYGEAFAVGNALWRLDFDADEIEVESVEQENPPPARMLHAFACDAAGEHFVIFGGASLVSPLGDTWIGRRTKRGVRWKRLEEDLDPGARYGFAFAYDVAEERLLVCGGQVPPEGGTNELAFARDLWALDFTAKEPEWTLLAEYDDDEFPGRRNPAFVLDEHTGDLLVWGGTGDGATALADLYVVRTREVDTPIERVAQASTIPSRVSCFGVVDQAGGRAFLGFGNTSKGIFEDLGEVRLRRPATSSDKGNTKPPR